MDRVAGEVGVAAEGDRYRQRCADAVVLRLLRARELQIAAVNPDVSGENTANSMQAAIGAQLRPVPVSPGLMVYLDQVKRNRLIRRWNEALRGQ